MRKKLKEAGGFSFVEMLCAVAILVLLCLIMSTCISMAVKSYRDITSESETQLLVSSLTDALADKLRYAVVDKDGNYSIGTVEVTDGTENYKDDTGAVIPAGMIVLQKTETTAGVTTTNNKRLLPDSAYGAAGQFSVGYIGRYEVSEEPGTPIVTCTSAGLGTLPVFTVKFTVSCEKAGVSKTAEFTVRCLNPVKKEVV